VSFPYDLAFVNLFHGSVRPGGFHAILRLNRSPHRLNSPTPIPPVNAEKTQMTRLSFYMSFMSMATAVAPFAGRPDVVFATTPPLFTGAAGLAIARMLGAPLVLDVRDLWPAAATSLLQISPGWETKAAELLERRLYRSAAAVTAVTRPFCTHIDRARPGQRPAVLLPNGTLERFFVGAADPVDRLNVPESTFLVTFAGTLGIAQALPTAIEAAERVNGDAEFAFVGDGPMKDSLVELARDGHTVVRNLGEPVLREVVAARVPDQDVRACLSCLRDERKHPLGQRFTVDLTSCRDPQTFHLVNQCTSEICFELHVIRTVRAARDDRL
jgi:hypothetical protein